MPYRFTFRNNRDNRTFACNLRKKRCVGTNKNGARCKRESYISVPYCWHHLRAEKFVAVLDSEIHGKGLFAYDPAAEASGLPVFARHSGIIPYVGERLLRAQLTQRYGGDEVTAPYAVAVNNVSVDDSACLRGAAANANTIIFPPGIHFPREDYDGVRFPTSAMIVRGRDGRRRRVRVNAIIANDVDDGPYIRAVRDIHHMEEIIVYYSDTYSNEGADHSTKYVRR